MKIVIAVISAKVDPYIQLENCIRDTWGKRVYDEIDIVYYYGDADKTYTEGDRFFSQAPEGLYNIGYKTIDLFEHLIENTQFDYLFRTNLSSYLNVSKLLEFISDKPREKFYSGVVGNFNNINYASGSGYFISNDIVRYVVQNKDQWNHMLIDDVALGGMMKDFNISVYPGKRLDLLTEQKVYDPKQYHYRCKHDYDRSKDIETMYFLDKHVDIV